MPPALILVRHAAPRIVEAEHSTTWVLSDEGRLDAERLGERLTRFQPAALVASTEPKARETASIIGRALRLEVENDESFVEHRRPGLGFVSKDVFEASIRKVFDYPWEVFFDGESADAVFTRFERALTRYTKRPLIIATHGTALSIYVSRRAGLEVFRLWSNLKLPEALILDEDGRLLQRITVNG
jgi:broad specificity phosphatase PhoE